MSTGHEMLFAPEDPSRTVKITSEGADLKLYDGRMIAQNGWFVLRSILPAGKTGKVFSWRVEPNAIDGWVREPNVGFSQVGYLPSQPKIAVVELDKRDKMCSNASVYKVNADGSSSKAFTGKVSMWGPYYKYNYAKFDLSLPKS